jgi:fumarate hydratase subunit beta
MREITTPLSDQAIRDLPIGETIELSGVIVTGRDMVHKWLVETFIKKTRQPAGDDLQVYDAIRPLLDGGVIYHCGPVVAGLDTGDYRFIAAGPTTSMREEAYQADVLKHFNLKGVIGKGGMGEKTLAACHEVPSVYFHAVGGAAVLIASTVKKVLAVHKLEFGSPEAIWVIEVERLPLVVTMDAHLHNLHKDIKTKSSAVLDELIDRH